MADKFTVNNLLTLLGSIVKHNKADGERVILFSSDEEGNSYGLFDAYSLENNNYLVIYPWGNIELDEPLDEPLEDEDEDEQDDE